MCRWREQRGFVVGLVELEVEGLLMLRGDWQRGWVEMELQEQAGMIGELRLVGVVRKRS